MPHCKKCNNHFPNKVLLEGKYRNFQRRKYCLNCSPFGGKNTRQLHIDGIPYYETLPTIPLKCTLCSREYLYHHRDPKGHTKTKCNSCLVNERRFALKKKCVEYKGGKCEKCGYSKSLRALSFHHLDETQKSFGISGSHCKSWETIRPELDKCIMICANCHMETHDEEIT